MKIRCGTLLFIEKGLQLHLLKLCRSTVKSLYFVNSKCHDLQNNINNDTFFQKKKWWFVGIFKDVYHAHAYIHYVTFGKGYYRITSYFRDNPIFAFFASIFESQTLQFA
jgi:hypothetical protein